MSNGLIEDGSWLLPTSRILPATSVFVGVAETGTTNVFEAICMARSQHLSITARGTSVSSRETLVLGNEFERIDLGLLNLANSSSDGYSPESLAIRKSMGGTESPCSKFHSVSSLFGRLNPMFPDGFGFGANAER